LSASDDIHCSVVIRAYNEEKHIGRLLTGLIQQTVHDKEIILVDSGSTDATVAIASRYPVKVVHIPPEAFTFGYSLNQGIAASRGEFIVIASAHVYPVYPDWLERILAPFQDPHVGLVYGKQRGNSTSKFSEQQIFATWFPDLSQHRQTHPFCNNANAAIRRVLWQKHPYDETLSGLEDLEWANWVIQENTISYVAEAEIIHVHDETPQAVYNRYRREAMAFRDIFPDERFNFTDFIRLFMTNVASDLWHAARQSVILSHVGNIIWFRLMQFWGTYQGYRQAGPLTAQLRQTFYYPRGLQSVEGALPRKVDPIDYGEIEG
jgi:glycosyltransferase involved in cell wall biosynthesis